MASSSSFTSRNYSYNVFASFHGPDVRKTLLSHIREQFTHNGITMFDDQKIVRSATIAPSLTTGIRESRIAIVILSKNYASSSWCLNELVEILECKKAMGQIVMTIFYGVDPSHVRKQTEEFGTSFNETCANKTVEERHKWSKALTEVGNIAGEDFFRWSNEAKMINKIARDVSDKLNATPSRDFDGMVGLEAHLREVESLLDFDDDDDGVKVVAITGPAGIGKTTIARAIHSLHSYKFQLTCFVDNLRGSYPIGSDEYGLKLRLQEEFLSNIFKQDGISIGHLGVIEERLHDQKVLIILDDVNNIKQLEALAGDVSWFGPGSRIVVTTENKDLMHQHGINSTYHVGFPSTGEAFEILCRYAFRNSYPHDGFQELALKVTDLCGNLPLGLRVVGSSLRGKKEDEWEDVMNRLESVLDRDIEDVLRVGYESLDENEQTLFLHIAVFFNYENGNLLKTMFADSDLDVKYGLKILVNRSLIELYNKKETITMHRLLQQVGIKAIHKQQSGKRRILIDAPEICDVLEHAEGTRVISGISFDISDIHDISISPRAFKKMPNLRFLRVYKRKEGGNDDVMHIPEEMEFPRRLRLLHWEAYPNKCLHPSFHPEYLVKLDMQDSQLEYLWQGTQPLANLKEIDLQRSFHLKELPDLSNATNLKRMYLSYCQSLVELPHSCSSLDKLKDLWMDHCTNLQLIPAHVKLASLKRVSMKGCSRLRHIPFMSTNIMQMDISETAVEDLPASPSICARPIHYSMIACQKLREITHLPLYVTELDLSKSSVEKIPGCIKDLRRLLKLRISGCRKLTSLPELPSQLMLLSGDDCESLEEVASPFHNPNASMTFTNCFRLRQQAIIQQWFCLGSAFLPGRQVPPEFDHRARGSSLTIPHSSFTRLKVCLVLLPNHQTREEDTTTSQLLCRRIVNGDLANSDDKVFNFNLSKCRKEHLFIFPSGLFEEEDEEGLPDEVGREIVFEFSSKHSDFDVVECGAKFLTDDENSYESESDQAATTIASFMGAMNLDPMPIIASWMEYESMKAKYSNEEAKVQLLIVNMDNQQTTSCCRDISSLVSSVFSRCL